MATLPCFLAGVVLGWGGAGEGPGFFLEGLALKAQGIFYDHHQDGQHLFLGFFSAT